MSKRNSVLAAAFITTALLNGQDTRGRIFGRVTDPQDSAVPGASVTVTNVLTNVSTTIETNEKGYYEANLLVAGTYQVIATASGMKKFQRQGVELNLGAHVPIDIRMEVGSVHEEVTVTGGAPLVETDNISTGRLLDNRSLNDLPVPNNNPILLAAFSPGVQERGGYRTNAHRAASVLGTTFYTPGNVGGRSNTDTSNDYQLDGMPNVGSSRRMAYLPHTDSIQEFKVETSNLDASVGFSSGITLSMMTKAGTNDLHGTATWQHMQARWNAAQYFLGQTYNQNLNSARAAGDTAKLNALVARGIQPPGHTNDYSVSLGGPVEIPKLIRGRNRLFFFFNASGTKQRMIEMTATTNVNVPTLKNRQGDFSDLLTVGSQYQIYDPNTVQPDAARAGHWIRSPFPGNAIPRSRWANPMTNFYNPLFPAPNNSPASDRQEPLNNYVTPAMPWNFDYQSQSSRIDYQFSERHRFFGRWNRSTFLEDRSDWTYETKRGFQTTGLIRNNTGAMLGWTYTPTARSYFDFGFSMNRYTTGNKDAVAKQFKPTDVGLPQYLDAKAADMLHVPVVSMTGYNSLGLNFSTLSYTTAYSAKAVYNRVMASHTVRAGFEARQYLTNGGGGGNTAGAFGFDNAYTRRNDDTFTPTGSLGYSYAAFLLGIPSSMQVVTNDTFAVHTPAYAWHAQDNWRVTSKLTLILGLRGEWESGLTERFNRALAAFDPSLQLPISQGAKAAYAANPVPELAASNFQVLGGTPYAGQGGAPRTLWGSQWMWLPRIGAAWQIRSKTVIRGGYGIFQDSLNATYLSPNQTGFSRTTSTNISNNYGSTWLVGNPAQGISPLTDPFPVRSDGTRFDLPVRNALGPMALVGSAYSFTNPNIRRARNQRWRASVQHGLDDKTVVEGAFAYSYGERVYVTHSVNPLAGQYWATGTARNATLDTSLGQNVTNPFNLGNFAALRSSDPVVYQQMSTLGFFTSSTIVKNQLLRPYPQMSGLTSNNDSVGKVWAPSMELSLRRSVSRGVSVNVHYTRMKPDAADLYLNEFDAEPTRRPSAYGEPHRLNVSALLEAPFGKGRRYLREGVASQILGGWQLGLTYEYQTGLPIDFGNLFYYGDPGAISSGPRTIAQWFNTAGCVATAAAASPSDQVIAAGQPCPAGFDKRSAAQPATFQTRTFPSRIAGVYGQRMNEWNASLQRDIALRERFHLNLRVDAQNLLNRTIFSNPVTTPSSTQFGQVTSTTEVPNRYIQVQMRLRF
ncbi:MAG: carboxypeptidase-like regulatory domain-containing protein [Bryobacteraceae bacterium]